MTLTIVGPNLPAAFSRRGTFHVHRAGCADLSKLPARAPHYNEEHATLRALAESIYPPEEFDMRWQDSLSDCYIAPCVTLPAE